MLSKPPVPLLRSALSTIKIHPTLISRCSASTVPQHRPKSSNSNLTTLSYRPFLLSRALQSSPSRPLLRSASTSSSPTSTASTNNPASSLEPTSTLDWNTYLSLRRTRRRYNLVASIFSSLGTTAIGVTVLSQQNFDQLGGLFGLDPFIVLGLATASSAGVGWLAGPFLGNAVFGVVYRRFRGQITEKERDFYRRIKRYRVDPSSQSFSNPVPDYYGEKIGSVGEFRSWMKDQRAYNKKRQSFV